MSTQTCTIHALSSAQLIDIAYVQFKKFLFRTTVIHSLFWMLLLGEGTFSLCFYYMYADPTFLGIALGVITFTVFAYFAMKIYLHAKREPTIEMICQTYIAQVKKKMSYQRGIFQHHVSLAKAVHALASKLEDGEYNLLLHSRLHSLGTTLETLGAFLYWKEFFIFREMLYLEGIHEYIKLVIIDPTSLEVHAALANAYVLFSSFLSDPRTDQSYDDEKWIPPNKFNAHTEQQFRNYAKKAIEEFKILNDYAPHEPWVHFQLAYSYHDLQMPDQEIREYETILKLQPDDDETLFKLGMLYFQQGYNAKGLHIYETLKRLNLTDAERLIKLYGISEP